MFLSLRVYHLKDAEPFTDKVLCGWSYSRGMQSSTWSFNAAAAWIFLGVRPVLLPPQPCLHFHARQRFRLLWLSLQGCRECCIRISLFSWSHHKNCCPHPAAVSFLLCLNVQFFPSRSLSCISFSPVINDVQVCIDFAICYWLFFT